MALSPEANNSYASVVIGMVVGLIFMTAVCTIAGIGISREKSIRSVMNHFCCMAFFEIVLVSLIITYSVKNYDTLETRLNILIDVGVVNYCAGEYN